MGNFRTICSGSPNAAYKLCDAMALLEGIIEVSPPIKVEIAGTAESIDIAVLERWNELDCALRSNAVHTSPSEYVLQLGEKRYHFYDFSEE